jgi:hypothetical protein
MRMSYSLHNTTIIVEMDFSDGTLHNTFKYNFRKGVSLSDVP